MGIESREFGLVKCDRCKIPWNTLPDIGEVLFADLFKGGWTSQNYGLPEEGIYCPSCFKIIVKGEN